MLLLVHHGLELEVNNGHWLIANGLCICLGLVVNSVLWGQYGYLVRI